MWSLCVQRSQIYHLCRHLWLCSGAAQVCILYLVVVVPDNSARLCCGVRGAKVLGQMLEGCVILVPVDLETLPNQHQHSQQPPPTCPPDHTQGPCLHCIARLSLFPGSSCPRSRAKMWCGMNWAEMLAHSDSRVLQAGICHCRMSLLFVGKPTCILSLRVEYRIV